MKKSVIPVLLALPFVFVPTVFAEDSVGLQAGPAKAIINEDVKQGDEVKINKLFIQNTGSLREKIVITTEGGVSVEEESLILQPQEKVFLEAMIRPDFTMNPGKTQGKIIVSATEDEGKGIQHNPAVELQFTYNLVEGSFIDKVAYYANQFAYPIAALAIALCLLIPAFLTLKKKRKTKPEPHLDAAV